MTDVSCADRRKTPHPSRAGRRKRPGRAVLIGLLFGATAPSLFAQTRFAIIGDYGNDSANESAVAALVAGWNVNFVVTVGDNRYGATTFDQTVGKYYCSFLKNAKPGTFCAGGSAPVNAFFPAIGNHEYTDGSGADYGLAGYLSYFTLPGAGIVNSSGNERYYDLVRGDVHLFVLNSYPAEPDGTTSGSVQGEWLRTRLAASTARLKIVFMHHAPYSSCTQHGSQPGMQWPFAAWGADVVVAGHDHTYERLQVNGIPYFVNGLGGTNIYSFGTPVPGSIVRYNGDYGAMLVESSGPTTRFRFINTSGTVIDDATITTDLPPTASLSATPTRGPAPLQVTFNASGSTDDRGVLTYAWSFGDGQVGSGVAPLHTYTTAGQYTATLTVTDDAGQSDTDQIQITVDPPPPTSVHIASIAATNVPAGKGYKLGKAIVQVVDSNGIPVSGAVVTGDWGGDIYETGLTGATGADGTVEIYSTVATNVTPPTLTFCVSAVSARLPYRPDDNASASFSCVYVDPLRLVARVFLEGPYRNGAMAPTPGLASRPPNTQPYAGPPWGYGGAEHLATDFFARHPETVDWVLVELRAGSPSGAMTLVSRRAGLVKQDGRICGPDGVDTLRFGKLAPAGYHVVIRHRNHLAAMSATPVDFSSGKGAWDATADPAGAYGSADALTALGGGRYGLFAGDADGNGQVDATDADAHWAPFNGYSGYRAPNGSSPDLDLNGQVQNTDKHLLWARNVGRSTHVPDL